MQNSSQEWTSVTERLPEIIEERGDSGHLQCYSDINGIQFVGFYDPEVGWQVSHHYASDKLAYVSHFSSLPEPPTR